MNYEQLENDVKDRLEEPLTEAVPNVKIELDPEYEDENTRPAENPRVTIFLDQSEFGKTKSSQYVAQDEDIKIFLLVRARKLRGDGGVYHIIEHIRAALVGFIPSGFNRMYLVKVMYANHERGVWHYMVSMGTQGMIVEDTTPPTAPTLKTPMADFSDNQYNN